MKLEVRLSPEYTEPTVLILADRMTEELDSWSIAAQSAAYFAVGALAMLPAAWIARWMEHSLGGFAAYLGIYCAIFVAVWLLQYLGLRARLRRINSGLGKNTPPAED